MMLIKTSFSPNPAALSHPSMVLTQHQPPGWLLPGWALLESGIGGGGVGGSVTFSLSNKCRIAAGKCQESIPAGPGCFLGMSSCIP